MLYPSTRPLDKTLEYSSNIYIPGITGNRSGVIGLLRDANITSENGRYKALYELDEDEMRRLTTSVLLKSNDGAWHENAIGNIFLIKFFNKLEDARELSALINACSRMNYPDIGLGFCLGNKNFRLEAEKIYIEYKQSLVSALKNISESDKVEVKDYIIINAKDKINAQIPKDKQRRQRRF